MGNGDWGIGGLRIRDKDGGDHECTDGEKS